MVLNGNSHQTQERYLSEGRADQGLDEAARSVIISSSDNCLGQPEGVEEHSSRSVLNHFVYFYSGQSELFTCSGLLPTLPAPALQQQQNYPLAATPPSGSWQQVH